MRRRTLFGAGLGAGFGAGLARPAPARAAAATTLRFVPVIDLAFTDPIFAAAQVTRTHGLMVFDMLYGLGTDLQVSPQMLDGHRTADDGLRWDLVLREGLLWHDGTPVLARDCVASIRRWAKRDGFGTALLDATDELSAADDRTIRFRLRRPFPLLPYALGKIALPACVMMPERLAATDPFKPVPEVVGSGPYRFVADERVQGARNVYARFEGYRPRQVGTPDWTAGPKVVHFDRVQWTTMPDPGTSVAALQAGEQDWMENAPHDLMPVLRRAPGIATRVLDPLGFTNLLQVNHLQPPFDNPAIRRALWGAIDQPAFMSAAAGTDPAFQHTPLGYFTPGTPMASDAGMEALTAPRDPERVKAELQRAGYRGEPVVLLVPADSVTQKPMGDVAADMFHQVGMAVEYVAISFGNVLTRRLNKGPPAQGGWSAFASNPQGIDWLNPVGHQPLQGNGTYAGWATSPRIPALRAAWLAASSLGEQQRICRDIQLAAFEEVPFYPIGQYKQPTAYRTSLTGILGGTATFWNVRPA